MKITIVICDDCNRRNDGDDETPVYSYRIKRYREMDASGNGYETQWEYADWCKDCYALNAMKIGKDNIHSDQSCEGL